jgi:hypothetical protein
VVILKLQLMDAQRLFVEIVSGRQLIETHLPQGCTQFSVTRPVRVITLAGVMVTNLLTAGHLAPTGAGAVGGTEAGAGAQGTQGGTRERNKRNRDSGEDGEDETHGDFLRDVMGGKRWCSSSSKKFGRIRSMNPMFRLCSEGFVGTYGRDLIVDVRELVSVIEGYAMDSSGLVEGHADYGFRMSAFLLSLRVMQDVKEDSDGVKTYPTFLAALHCTYDPFDLRALSLISFLPPGEGQAGWFAKGVRSATGRALVATGIRNHGILWQALSCEGFATATTALEISLLTNVSLWQRIDNVVILANCTRMLSRFYVDLRSQTKSVSFPDTPMSCGKECATLLGLYSEKLLAAVMRGDEKEGFSPYPHIYFYDAQFGVYPKLRLPSFFAVIKEKTPEMLKTEREVAAAAKAAAAAAKAAAALSKANAGAASRWTPGGGERVLAPDGNAVCKAALCQILGVQNGKGVAIVCTRKACRFRHPATVGEVTQAEADAAASVDSRDPAMDANLRAKCRTRSAAKGWMADA